MLSGRGGFYKRWLREFERSIRKFMANLHAKDPAIPQGQSLVAKRNECQKKPPFRWNEDAGFLTQLHRSAMKKSAMCDPLEGPKGKKAKLKDSIATTWFSMEFMGSCNETAATSDASEEFSTQVKGYLLHCVNLYPRVHFTPRNYVVNPSCCICILSVYVF